MGWYLSWGLSGKESTFFRADKENSSQETGRGRGTLAGMCLVWKLGVERKVKLELSDSEEKSEIK